MSQCFIFLRGSFINKGDVRNSTQEVKAIPSILYSYPWGHIYPFLYWQHLKSLCTIIHIVSKVRLKLRDNLKLLLYIRSLLTFTEESSVISLDGNITGGSRKIVDTRKRSIYTDDTTLCCKFEQASDI